ncbi:cytochrome [Sesamum alatum]|uniref:Cytochrome n=1 Tax=Sesamum alatum TaxID=300844 RepID=A0AAE2CG27_9LAMI|nr:cytochrome [Sesamum alatum]
MHLKLGEVDAVVVSSAEAAKEVLKMHDINFAYRPSLLVTDILCYGNTNIAFAPYGEYWRQLRKICTLELLSAKLVQSFGHIREEEFLNLCRWIASQSGLLINLTERINLTTSDVVTWASHGKKTEEQAAFTSVIKETIELAAGFHIADVYPSIKLFSRVSGMKGGVERLHKESDRILQSIINDHRAINAAKNAGQSENHEDLIDVLLKFHDSGDELHLTIDNLKSVLQDMFSAGSETSSTTVDWAMAEMLKHPRILKKAQDEGYGQQREKAGNNGDPSGAGEWGQIGDLGLRAGRRGRRGFRWKAGGGDQAAAEGAVARQRQKRRRWQEQRRQHECQEKGKR